MTPEPSEIPAGAGMPGVASTTVSSMTSAAGDESAASLLVKPRRGPPLRYPFDRMAVGETFFVADRFGCEAENARCAAVRSQRRTGRRFRSKKVEACHDDDGGRLFWRVA